MKGGEPVFQHCQHDDDHQHHPHSMIQEPPQRCPSCCRFSTNTRLLNRAAVITVGAFRRVLRATFIPAVMNVLAEKVQGCGGRFPGVVSGLVIHRRAAGAFFLRGTGASRHKQPRNERDAAENYCQSRECRVLDEDLTNDVVKSRGDTRQVINLYLQEEENDDDDNDTEQLKAWNARHVSNSVFQIPDLFVN